MPRPSAGHHHVRLVSPAPAPADTYPRPASPEGGTIARNTVTASAFAALALVLIQFGVIRLCPWELPVRVVVPATIAAVPLALWPQRRFIGTWVLMVGVVANLVAVTANGGLMPIERTTLESVLTPEVADAYQAGAWISGSKDVLVTGDDGHLVALGDSIVIRMGPRGIVASPGDVVLFAGVLILAAEGALAWNRRRATRPEASEAERGAARGGAITPR